MQRRISILIALLAAGHAMADAPTPSFDHYEIILQRKPFGDLPPPIVENQPPPPDPVIVRFYRLCSFVQEDDGTIKVGIVDTRVNKSIVLSPGQSENGLAVLEASYEEETALLQFGGEIQLLELKSGTTPGSGQPATQVALARGVQSPRVISPGTTYEERRGRLPGQHASPAPQPKYTGQALQKHLQDYQMKVIRQGLPPLPVALTPEQDAQLVKEGVLPPQR